MRSFSECFASSVAVLCSYLLPDYPPSWFWNTPLPMLLRLSILNFLVFSFRKYVTTDQHTISFPPGPSSRTQQTRRPHGKTFSASAKATSPRARSRRSATPSASSGWAAPNTACGNPKARCSLPIVLPSSSSLVPRHFLHPPHQTSITSSVRLHPYAPHIGAFRPCMYARTRPRHYFCRARGRCDPALIPFWLWWR